MCMRGAVVSACVGRAGRAGARTPCPLSLCRSPHISDRSVPTNLRAANEPRGQDGGSDSDFEKVSMFMCLTKLSPHVQTI